MKIRSTVYLAMHIYTVMHLVRRQVKAEMYIVQLCNKHNKAKMHLIEVVLSLPVSMMNSMYHINSLHGTNTYRKGNSL